MSRKKISLIFIISAAILKLKVYADPFDFYCSGPQARSIGCTGVAISEGYESAYLNPALISAAKKVGIGYIFSSQNVDVSFQGQKKVGNPLEDVSLVHAGLSLALSDLSFIFEKSKILDNIYLGISAALPPSGRLVRVSSSGTKVPSTILYGNRNTRFSAYVGLSGRIPVDKHNIYIGGGVHSLAKLPIYVDANLAPDKDLLGIDGWLEVLEGFLGGIAFELNFEQAFIKIGGVLRTSVQTDIPTSIEAKLAGDETVLLINASFIEHYTPSYFGGGIGGGLKSSSLKIGAGVDVLQYKFSELKLPLLEITNASPEQVKTLIPPHKIPTLDDVLVIKGGVSADVYDVIAGEADIILGAGVSLFPSPLKSQNGSLFVDSDRFSISGGLGTRFKSPGVIKGEIEFIISGGVQMIQKKDFAETGTSIGGTLPTISGTLNILF